MTCDSATPFYSLQDSNQVLSRELELQNGIEVLALNYANVNNRPYRLFIEEKNNNSVIEIALAFGYKSVTETVVLFCNPGGAIEYFSTRPATIRVKAMTGDATIIAVIEGDP